MGKAYNVGVSSTLYRSGCGRSRCREGAPSTLLSQFKDKFQGRQPEPRLTSDRVCSSSDPATRYFPGRSLRDDNTREPQKPKIKNNESPSTKIITTTIIS